MIKNLLAIILLLSLTYFTACNPDNNEITLNIEGKAQKGPLVKGSVVTLSELNKNLIQTGRVFTANILDDNGTFEISNATLQSNYALLTANGFYFNEVYGKLSPSQITLQAYVDLLNKEKINVNILTHVTKQRIEKLIADGINFSKAKEQAEKEFLFFMGSDAINASPFEEMDISKSANTNAPLLAFSIISQRRSYIWGNEGSSTAELSDLLTRISTNFKDNGTLNDNNIIDTLMHNIYMINLEEVRSHITEHYAKNKKNVILPDFEKYIHDFQKKNSQKIVENFEYPTLASPDMIMSPNSSEIENLLTAIHRGNLECKPYSIAAIAPFDKKIVVKITSLSGSTVAQGGLVHGWKSEWNPDTKVLTFISNRHNTLMSGLLHLWESGRALVEIFEDDMNKPKVSKEIQW
jgi:hypothetical protein